MNDFTITGLPKLIFGAGKINELPNFVNKYGENILLITGGRSLKKSGTLDIVERLLSKCKVYKAVVCDEPSPKIVDSIVKENTNNSINCVCAIGGGSVLDAGKAVSAMLEEDNFITVKDYLEGVGTKEPNGNKIPFIAVPTTSGTGSEATKNAVISQVGNDGFKKSLRHDNYIPNIAIIDPELILKCPPSVTAASGLDALSQLMESYISNNANSFTDSLAKDAIIRMLKAIVPVCCEEPENIEYRSDIAYGAFISGITLAHAGLGTVHGIAGVIGGYKNIPHGLACGLLLPYWLDETVSLMQENESKYESFLLKIELLSKELFPAENESEKLIENLVQCIFKMSDVLQLPRLRTFDVTKEELELFAKEGGNKNNPIALTFEQKLKILRNIY
jgi:alcohol dehydrogenase class IV